MTNRFTAVAGALWDRKWWLLGPTLLAALATSLLSSYYLPTRYQSVTTIVVLTPMPADVVRSTTGERLGEHVDNLKQQILSRTALERIIEEFGLYQEERQTEPLENIIQRMRDEHIRLAVLPAETADGHLRKRLTVTFESPDPRTAMEVSGRLAIRLVDESFRMRMRLADSANQFVEARIADVRRRILEQEALLDQLRRKSGDQPLSQADLLPYEVLKETYRTLLHQQEESRLMLRAEETQIGEQFRIVESARFPERPVGPGRREVNAAGTLAGLAVGLVFVARGRRRQSA